MSEIIKVRINADGVSATEVNHFGEKPIQYNYEVGFIAPLSESSQYLEWKLAESKLRTFEIKDCRKPCWGEPVDKCCCRVSNSIHSAEILYNDKLTIRII